MKVAVVGYPNVGKSSLVNRLTRLARGGRPRAPGITRDRNEMPARVERPALHAHRHRRHGLPRRRPDRRLDPRAGAGGARRRARSRCFVVDARAGVRPGDEELADLLRRWKRPVIVAANKVDTVGDMRARRRVPRARPRRSAGGRRPRRGWAPATCSTASTEALPDEGDAEEEDDDRPPGDRRAPERRQVDARQPLRWATSA